MLWQSSHSDLSTGSVKKTDKDGRSGGRMMIFRGRRDKETSVKKLPKITQCSKWPNW